MKQPDVLVPGDEAERAKADAPSAARGRTLDRAEWLLSMAAVTAAAASSCTPDTKKTDTPIGPETQVDASAPVPTMTATVTATPTSTPSASGSSATNPLPPMPTVSAAPTASVRVPKVPPHPTPGYGVVDPLPPPPQRIPPKTP